MSPPAGKPEFEPDEAPTPALPRVVAVGRRVLSILSALGELDAERLLLICTTYAEVDLEERTLLYEHARIARARGNRDPIRWEDLDDSDV